jgi:uncharacterized protein (DUF2236 family)
VLPCPLRLLAAAPVLGPLRRTVAGSIRRSLAGDDAAPPPFDLSEGDAGLFGPRSVTWAVHADLPAMLIGGVRALLLQTLHPLAMAGVAEHSTWRDDPLGRLQRTADFLGTTTFGTTEDAEAAIERVRFVHRHVVGTAPDGRPYHADDPALLCWVHTAEVDSFLRAFQRYGPRPLDPSGCDTYLTEMAVVARRLGATWVPSTADEVDAYLRRVRPELDGGRQARETVRDLLRGPGLGPAERVAYALVVAAAVELLPGWACRELGIRRLPVVEVGVVRPAAHLVSETVRWALGPSPVIEAARARADTALLG